MVSNSPSPACLCTFFIHLNLRDSVLEPFENYQNGIDDTFISNALLMVKAVSVMKGVSSSKAFRGTISDWQTCKHTKYFPHIDTGSETLLGKLKIIIPTNFTSKTVARWKGNLSRRQAGGRAGRRAVRLGQVEIMGQEVVRDEAADKALAATGSERACGRKKI